MPTLRGFPQRHHTHVEANRRMASYRDDHPNLALCIEAQRYYEQHGFSTQVLPASLTTIQECVALTGVHHITIAPPLLRELSEPRDVNGFNAEIPSLLGKEKFEDLSAAASRRVGAGISFIDDEEAFRMAVTRNSNGMNEPKLTQVCCSTRAQDTTITDA